MEDSFKILKLVPLLMTKLLTLRSCTSVANRRVGNLANTVRHMRLMWTPPTLWNHPVDGFEH